MWEGNGTVRKLADTDLDRKRLAAEARLLASVPHPGVVHIVGVIGGDPPDALEFQLVSGGTLVGRGPQPVQVAAGFGTALATTVADLHDVGVAHGALRPEHVLIGAGGRPVLCGFGQASEPGHFDARRRQDVRDLVAILRSILPANAEGRRVAAVLREAEGSSHRRRVRSARWIANRLIETVPDGCLFDCVAASPATETTRSRPIPVHRRRVVIVGVAAFIGLVLAVSVVVRWPARKTAPPRCTSGGSRCRPAELITFGSAEYRLAGLTQAAVVVKGRWACSPVALLTAIYVDSGQVWVFESWPGPGSQASGTLAGLLPGAEHAEAVAVSPGCDALRVQKRGGGTVQIVPVAPSQAQP
jgi:tRNA A-37 threonylcarbamoyl transferase component Bud32